MLTSFKQLFTVNGVIYAMALVVGITVTGVTLAPAIESIIAKKE